MRDDVGWGVELVVLVDRNALQCRCKLGAPRLRADIDGGEAAVVSNISEFQIIQFIRRLNFMQLVTRSIKSIISKCDTATPKDITADVQCIKEFLRQCIGSTYPTATQPSDANLLGVDMTDWGGLRRQRACAPFNQVRNANGGYREYVRHQLAKLCPWHHWV